MSPERVSDRENSLFLSNVALNSNSIVRLVG